MTVPNSPPGIQPGSESSKLLSQGLIYSLSSAAPVLVTLVVTPALTRSIDASQYGVVGLGLVIIQVGLVVLGFGLQEPIARHGILGLSGIPGARAIVLMSIVPSAFLTALVCVTSPWWTPAVFNVSFNVGYIYALIAAWFFSVIASIQGVMRAQDRPVPLVAVGLVASLAAPVLGLVLVQKQRADGGTGYLLGIALGYGLALGIGLLDFFRAGKATRHPGDFLSALRLGLAMIFHQSAVYLATAVCVVLTSHRLGVGEAGRMQLSLYVATAPAIIAVALSNSWSPIIYRTPPARRTEVASTLVSDVAKVIALLCGGLTMLFPVLLPLLMPSTYRPDELVSVASVACVGAIFFVAYLATVHLMMAEGRNAALVYVVPGSIAIAAITLALIPAQPALLALGFPLATLVMAGVTRLVLPRISHVSWRIRGIAMPTLTVLALGVIGGVIPGDGVWLVFRLAVASILGFWGLRYLRRVFAGSAPAQAPAGEGASAAKG